MKKLLISVVVAGVVIGGGIFVLKNIVINGPEMAKELEATLEKTTGREVQISQSPQVSLFPPQVVFHGIDIGNLEGASSKNFLSASTATFHLGIGSLFSGSAKPSSVIIDGGVIDFEAMPNGQRNWQFTGKQQDSSAFRTYFRDTQIQFKNTLIRYSNAATGAFTQFNDINGVLSYENEGKQFSYKGKVTISGSPAEVDMKMDSVDLTQINVPNVPFDLTLKHLDSVFRVKGELASASKDPELVGNMEAELPNLGYMMTLFLDSTQKPSPDDLSTAKVTAKGPITIGIKQISTKGMEILAVGGDTVPVLKGTLDGQYEFGKKPILILSPRFESLDVDYLRRVYNNQIIPEVNPGLVDVSAIPGEKPEKSDQPKERSWKEFVNALQGNLDFKVDTLIYNGRSVKSVELQTVFDKGNFIINLGRANLPGDTWLVFSGVSQIANPSGLFNGKMELQGKHMEELLALFAERSGEGPSIELGQFGLRSNIAMTNEQFRLSEMMARLVDTRMAGALIFHRGDRLKLESYLRVADVNLDKLHDAMIYLLPKEEGISKVDTGAGGERLFDVEYTNNTYNWLNSVGMDISADMLLENFVLYERKGERAKFTFVLRVGEMGLEKVDANYNNSDITGDYYLRTENGKNPFIDVRGTVSSLDLADLLPEIARVQNEDEWQKFLEQPIDLLLLQTYRGKGDMQFGNLKIRGYEFENVHAAGTLEKNKLEFQKLDGSLWNGGVEVRAAIQAGTIPGLSAAFVLNNANLVRLSQMTNVVKHAAGQIGIRGQLVTSGVSLRSWFQNATGAMSVVGRDVSFQGFGLATLARAVPIARAVADLTAAKRSSLEGGVARFNSMEGQLAISDGGLDVTRGTFVSEESQGNVSGRIDLLNEIFDLMVNFYLKSTMEQNKNPPKMTLKLKGPVDSVDKDLEMQEMEAYVAREAAERNLEGR